MVSPSPFVGKSKVGYRYQEGRTALIFPGWRLPGIDSSSFVSFVILSHDLFCLNSKIGTNAMGRVFEIAWVRTNLEKDHQVRVVGRTSWVILT